MRTLLPLLLPCLLLVLLVVGDPQGMREIRDMDKAEVVESPKTGGSAAAVPSKGKTAGPPSKDSTLGKTRQPQPMDKSVLGKEIAPAPPSTPSRGKNPPIPSFDKSLTDPSELLRETPARKDAPALASPKEKTSPGVGTDSPVNKDIANKAGPGLQAQAPSPAGSGPSLKPGVVPMGPVVDPRAPGPHNGWGYYNEFNYPSRLARPRAFSYNDAQRLMIKASSPFTLASLILAAMYIL